MSEKKTLPNWVVPINRNVDPSLWTKEQIQKLKEAGYQIAHFVGEKNAKIVGRVIVKGTEGSGKKA